MLGTWPLTVAAVVYFIYAVGLIAALAQGYATGDPRVSGPFVIVAVALAIFSAGLGLGMLRVRRGKNLWLIWMVGGTASLAGLTAGFVGWVFGVVMILPLLFGMLGVPRLNDDG